MIDLHCHFLPGIDDGAKTMDDALAMAKLAIENGIHKAVVTPHITPGRYDNDINTITEAFNQFTDALSKHNIELALAMAAEVRLDPLILSMVEKETLPLLGELDGMKIMLLEFPHSTLPPGALETVKWLIKNDICPVIAHPERNKSVISDYKKIKPFVDAGCLLQITAASMQGTFGRAPKSIGKKILKSGWVSLIASDAHNLSTRPPEMEPGRRVVEKIVGENKSLEMIQDLPSRITSGRFQDKA
jgi:protein-tyrosine phosphatase